MHKYQDPLQTMKGSEFLFYFVDGIFYKFHTTSLNRGRTYIDSPKWMRNKGATTKPKTNNNRCFQYAVAAALNRESIGRHSERISKIIALIH